MFKSSYYLLNFILDLKIVCGGGWFLLTDNAIPKDLVAGIRQSKYVNG